MKTLSIKARLALVLFVLAAFLTGVGALGLVGNLRSNAALKETFSNNLPSTRALGLAESKLAQARTALDRAIFEPDPSKSADALGRIATQIESSEKAWKDYLALPFSTPEEERIAGEAGKQRSLIIKERSMRSAVATRMRRACWHWKKSRRSSVSTQSSPIA